MSGEPVVAQRRQTYYFLDQIRSFAPVYLDTEVDMSGVLAHRERERAQGRRYSVVTYVIRAGAGVLGLHPQANAAIRAGLLPRVRRYAPVNVKVALDREIDGQRAVLSAVLPDLAKAELPQIQADIDRYRDTPVAGIEEFAHVLRLQKLPVPVGRALFSWFVRSLKRRGDVFGTLAVTSLGHRAVDSFHSVGGTTVTLGVGRITERPVVREGAVQIAPVMRLSLCFDHRVIDGGEAADILTEVRDALENVGGPA